jgi:integrase
MHRGKQRAGAVHVTTRGIIPIDQLPRPPIQVGPILRRTEHDNQTESGTFLLRHGVDDVEDIVAARLARKEAPYGSRSLLAECEETLAASIFSLELPSLKPHNHSCASLRTNRESGRMEDAMALTVREVEREKKPGRYCDGNGLYLQITPTGVKSWLLRYERNGKERWMGLGPTHTFSLEEARERARKARQQLADGVDPLDARAAERALAATAAAQAIKEGKTFEQVANDFFAFHSPSWKSLKHAKQFTSSMERFVFPTIGKMPVAAIDKTMIIDVLKPIWYSRAATAKRVRNRIERVLAYAKTNGYCSGDNPAAWSGNLEHMFPSVAKTVHHDALSYSEIGNFIADLRIKEGIAARALEFLILTAARTGEVRGAVWDEFDQAKRVWTIPAERMKAEREHKVPLSDRAMDIILGLPKEAEYVFVGSITGAMMAINSMPNLLKEMRPGVTVHGFRSCFRDWAADCTSYRDDVCEMALAHSVGSNTKKAYKRSDLFLKRKSLMADWAKWCDTPPDAADNVVPLRAG